MIVNPKIILPDLSSAPPAVSGGTINGSSQGNEFARMLMQSLLGLNNQNAQDAGAADGKPQSPQFKVLSGLTSIGSPSTAESEAELVGGTVNTQLQSPIILKIVSDGSNTPALPGAVNLPPSAGKESVVIGAFISLPGKSPANSANPENPAVSLPSAWIT